MRMAPMAAAVISSLAASIGSTSTRAAAIGVGYSSRSRSRSLIPGAAAAFATTRHSSVPRPPSVLATRANSPPVAVAVVVGPGPSSRPPPRPATAGTVAVMSSRDSSSRMTHAAGGGDGRRSGRRRRGGAGGGGEERDDAAAAAATALSSSASGEDDGDVAASAAAVDPASAPPAVVVPLYRSEGLFAVVKPLEWTSQDAVAFVRKMLERDARDRGAVVAKLGRRRGGGKKNKVKVGHGGTLDPLATGVLVLGVGRGTKELQRYLSGNKRYTADVTLGYETTTLDSEGDVTREAPHDHVTLDQLRDVVRADFTGKIMQIPPVYSAIQKDGKRLYEEARKGKTAEELGVEAREVHIHEIEILPRGDGGGDGEGDVDDEARGGLPLFGLEVECGGGTYVRSLVRDVGRSVGSAATMTGLVRTRQGPFLLEHCLKKEEWTPERIAEAIDEWNRRFAADAEAEVAAG